MARRPAFLQHEAAQARAVVVKEGRRAHGACHQDGVVGQRSLGRHHVAADELVQQAVGEIVEIVQAVPQIRVGLAQHPGAVVRLHPLDSSFRGEAGADSLAHAPEPALIVGEHPESLEDLPVLAVMGDVAALDQLVDGGADLADRLLEALEFGLEILGDQVFEHDPGFVQHHVTKANAFRQDRPACTGADGGTRCRSRPAPAPAIRLRPAFRPAPWRWSGGLRVLRPHRPGRCGSAPPARPGYCRRAEAGRPGTRGRFLRRSRACTRRPDDPEHPTERAARRSRR